MTGQPLIRPLAIGSVVLPNNLALAPMAGTSDLVFRRICHRMGAGLTVTELVSARGLVHDPSMRRSWRYLAIDPQAGAMAIQLFGADPEDFSRAITGIMDHPLLGQCSLIDINMGCPVKKVVAEGAGCALMRTPETAARIVLAAVRAVRGTRPITVKCRSGWDEQTVNAPAFARLVAECGAAAITIHARTRQQMYNGTADWSVIAAVRDAVTIPVFGNGDIRHPADAARMLRETQAHGLMIGRGAQGNPWIFSQVLQALSQPGQPVAVPTIDERIAVVAEHYDGMAHLLGEPKAVREMRRHLSAYLRGTRNAARLRAMGLAAETRADLLKVLEEWRICWRKSCENS